MALKSVLNLLKCAIQTKGELLPKEKHICWSSKDQSKRKIRGAREKL